jgi:hypothetical protein
MGRDVAGSIIFNYDFPDHAVQDDCRTIYVVGQPVGSRETVWVVDQHELSRYASAGTDLKAHAVVVGGSGMGCMVSARGRVFGPPVVIGRGSGLLGTWRGFSGARSWRIVSLMNMATSMQAAIRILSHMSALPKPFGIVVEIGGELGWRSANGYYWIHVSAAALGHDNLGNIAILYLGHRLGPIRFGNVCPSAIKNLNPRRDVLGVFIIFDDRWLVQVSTKTQNDTRILFRHSKYMVEGQFRRGDVVCVKVVVSPTGLYGENSRDVSVENVHERDCGSAYPAPSGN